MFVRRSFLGAILLVIAVGTACNKPTRIGVVPKSVEPVFWQIVRAGTLAAASEAGVEIDWEGAAEETDYSTQIEIVERMLPSGVDGLIVAPSNAVRLVGVVEKAFEAGVPVTIFDSALQSDHFVSFVATNNYSAGITAGKRMGEALDGTGKVAMVRWVYGSASTTQRERGFEDALEEFPGVEIVAERFCQAQLQTAIEVTLEMLAEHEDLNGVFASTEPSTLGATTALKEQGIGGTVKLVGFDFSDELEAELKAGVIDSLVIQDPFGIGSTAVRTIVARLNGETPDKVIQSPSHLVTVENLSRPEIDTLLHPDVGGESSKQ